MRGRGARKNLIFLILSSSCIVFADLCLRIKKPRRPLLSFQAVTSLTFLKTFFFLSKLRICHKKKIYMLFVSMSACALQFVKAFAEYLSNKASSYGKRVLYVNKGGR